MIYRVVTGLLLAGWMILIFWFSHQPADTSSELSGGLCVELVTAVNENFHLGYPPETVLSIAGKIEYPVRKAAHMSEYAVLGWLAFAFFRGFCSIARKNYLCSMALVVIYAATDEMHQLFVAGRAGRISDVLIDSAGAVLGLLLLFAAERLVHRRKRPISDENLMK